MALLMQTDIKVGEVYEKVEDTYVYNSEVTEKLNELKIEGL